MPRLFAIVVLLALTALIAGCGEEDSSASDARDLLAQAFDTPVESGRMSVNAELQVDGIPLLDGIELQANGPFTREALDLDITVGGLGPGLSGGLVVTEENLYIEVGGSAYEVGEEAFGQIKREFREDTGHDTGATFEQLGIDIENWISDPTVEGSDEVSGTTVTKVSGGVDARQALADLEAPLGLSREPLGLSEEDRDEIARLVEDARIDIYVDEEADVIRRVTFDMELEVPEQARDDLGGAEGGAVTLDVTLTDIGEPQEIEAPADARPLEDLLRRFGLGAELFLQ